MTVNKTFLEFASWIASSQCRHGGSDAERGEACRRSSPSRPLPSDLRSIFVAPPLLQDLTPRRALVSSWDSHVGVWAPFHLPHPLPARRRELLLHRRRLLRLLFVSMSGGERTTWWRVTFRWSDPCFLLSPHNGPENGTTEDESRCLLWGVEQRGAHIGFAAGFSARVLLIYCHKTSVK